MKAIVTTSYGDSSVLAYQSVDKPNIEKNELLIKVKAVSVNPLDFRVRSGELKIMTGKTAPHILGTDYAGIVEEVGSDVSEYKVGDEIFGLLNGMKNKEGTYAEYVKVNEDEVAHKPKNIDFNQASTFPMTVSTAYNALKILANIQAKDKVLIYSASGGVGMASVQYSLSVGAEVTAVVSNQNLDFMKSLGIDKVIDYTQEEVDKNEELYDGIFDTSAHFSFKRAKNILTKHGIYVSTDATPQAIIFNPIFNLFRTQTAKVVMTQPNKEVLKKAKELVESEAIKHFIYKTFKLPQMQEAHTLAEKGGFRGKIVVEV